VCSGTTTRSWSVRSLTASTAGHPRSSPAPADPATLRRSPPDRFIARRWASFVGPLRRNHGGRTCGHAAHSHVLPHEGLCR
jgi:hypothetical protein